MKTRGRRSGFTLIEILVFIAIFSIIIVSFITILTSVTQLQVRQSSAAYVAQESQALIQHVQSRIMDAGAIDMPVDVPTSTLTLEGAEGNHFASFIRLSGGTVFEGVFPITSGNVSVSNLSFTRHYNANGSSSVFGSDSVSFSFTMSAGATGTSQFYSQSFQSSVAASTPVPVIDLRQEEGFFSGYFDVGGQNVDPGLGVIAPVGDLFLLVVESTPTSTVSISDPAETWTKLADVLYPAYDSELSVFEAVNATTSDDSPYVTLGATSSATEFEAAMFDYRGTSTPSPFDASSSEIQSNTQTPDSGFVHPTSSVELLFGITLNPTTPEVPSAGSGFNLETWVGGGALNPPVNIFVEDKTQYITGPVSAGWQYSQTTPSSSLSLLLTFK